MTSSDQHPDEPARAPEVEPTPQEAAPQPTPIAAQNGGGAGGSGGREEGGAQPGGAPADDAGDEDAGGDESEAEGGEQSPEQAAAAPGPAGAPGTKKKRRRRRKKRSDGSATVEGAQPAGEGSAEGAESAAAEGKEGEARKDRPKKKDRPREQRERPAFTVGDIVFGKIIEITDDALFVDLSGKGLGIFNRRELDLPDDLEYGADPEQRDDEFAPLEPGEASTDANANNADAVSTDAAEGASEGHDEAAPVEAAPEPAVVEVSPPVRHARIVTVPHRPEPTPEGEPAPVAEAAPAVEAPAEVAAPEPPREEPKPSSDFPIVVLEVGAPFVGIVHNDGGRGGLVVLTRHPKRQQRAKLVTGGAFKEKGEILGLVTGVIKGGVEVDIDGLRAFAPGSHMDLRLGVDLHPLIGKRLLFLVTQYAKRGRDVVLSRRPFLESEARATREEALKTLPIGTIVEGTVRSVVGFGAFVDVGGVEGLVPLAEMSHNRGDGPHDVFKVGEKTPVKIMKVDDRGKIWLSRRAAIPDPWLEVAKKYAMGSKHTGKVVRLQPFGAFVELEPGIDGLIHTADLSLKRIEHPSEVVKEGDSLEVVVVHLEIGSHKIGLHPAPTGDAANETPQRVMLNKPLKVAVIGYEATGLLVRVLGATGRHARGFISAAATGTPRGTDLRREFPLGKQMDAKVTEMDPRKGELKLSVKALSEDTERTAYRQYREQVTRTAKFGTFGDLLKKNLQK